MINYVVKLRAYAILAVVLIHSTMTFVINEEIGSLGWWTGNIIDGSARWCVPIFFMISGMLLLDREEPVKTVLNKRVVKLLIPLVIWSFFYSFWDLRFGFNDSSFKEGLIDLYSNDAKYHLWYLYAAIGLYLALPLFRVFVRHAKRQEILYFILFSFGISAIATTVDKIYGIKAPVGFEYFLGYGSFLLLGYYMAKFEIKYSRLIYLMGALAIFVTIIGTWYVSSLQNDLNQVFYEYLSFTTPIAAGALFLYMKNHDSNKVSNVIAILSKYSFGIYLIHPIFIDLLRSEELESLFNFSVNQLQMLLNLLLTFVLATILSILIAKLLSRIPVLNKLV